MKNYPPTSSPPQLQCANQVNPKFLNKLPALKMPKSSKHIHFEVPKSKILTLVLVGRQKGIMGHIQPPNVFSNHGKHNLFISKQGPKSRLKWQITCKVVSS